MLVTPLKRFLARPLRRMSRSLRALLAEGPEARASDTGAALLDVHLDEEAELYPAAVYTCADLLEPLASLLMARIADLLQVCYTLLLNERASSTAQAALVTCWAEVNQCGRSR